MCACMYVSGWFKLQRIMYILLIRYLLHLILCFKLSCVCMHGYCGSPAEGSQSEYVIFQAACTLKGAIVREWNMLSANQLEELRLYLLQYTANHTSYVVCVQYVFTPLDVVTYHICSGKYVAIGC